MTPMHLQLVSDANGEWAAGLPAARVDPGDTEEMVVVVVVVVVGGGRGRLRWRDGARAAAGRGGGEGRTQAALCCSPHPKKGFVATGWGSSTPSTRAPPSVADPPPPLPPPPSFPLPPPLKQMGLVYRCTLKVATAIAVVVFV